MVYPIPYISEEYNANNMESKKRKGKEKKRLTLDAEADSGSKTPPPDLVGATIFCTSTRLSKGMSFFAEAIAMRDEKQKNTERERICSSLFCKDFRVYFCAMGRRGWGECGF